MVRSREPSRSLCEVSRARARVSTGSKVGMGQATLDAAIHTLNAIRVHPVSIYHFQTLVHGFLGHVISYRDGEGGGGETTLVIFEFTRRKQLRW